MTRTIDTHTVDALDEERVELRVRISVLEGKPDANGEIERLRAQVVRLNATIAKARTNGRKS